MKSLLAIAAGAVLGAWLRWGLALWLNPMTPNVPLGTLTANLAGGYLVGVAIAVFALNVPLPSEWRLLIVTGFLGALTTFSTFSAESVLLIERGDYGFAILHSAAHLFGSLLMTAAGVYTVRSISA